MTLHVATGPRRRESTGTPPRGLVVVEIAMKSTLEITLPSELRTVLIQIDSLRSMMRPNYTIQPAHLAILEAASKDLSRVIAEVTAWTDELRAERFARTTASMKASLTRSLRPPLVRRRRR